MSFRGQLIKAGITTNGSVMALGTPAVNTVQLSIGTKATGIKFVGAYTTAAIQIGTDAAKLELAAAGDYAIDINTNCDITSGNVTAFHLKSTLGGTGSNSVAALFHVYSDKLAGTNTTVADFHMEYSSDVSIGSSGLSSALTARISLPSSPVFGAFFPIYAKMDFTTIGLQPAGQGGASAGWFLLSTAGETVGKDDFDNCGLFMEIHNITAEVDHLLSATGQTLRCAVPDATTLRYLFLSQYQDTVSIGLTGGKKSLVTGVPEIVVWSTSALTGATQDVVKIDFTQTAAVSSGYIKGIRVTMNTEVQTPSSFRGIWSKLDFGTTGYTQGTASCICAELLLNDTNGGMPYGAYSCFEATINQPAAHDLEQCFMRMYATGTAVASFRSNGYILYLTGLSAAAGGIVSANQQTLRISLEGIDRFMVLSRTENTLELGASDDFMTIVSSVEAIATYSEVAATAASGWMVPVWHQTQIAASVDCSGTIQVFPLHTQLNWEGAGTWSGSGSCAGLVGYYSSTSSTVTVTDGIHSAVTSNIACGSGYALSAPADLCSLFVASSVNGGATVAGDRFSGIMIARMAGKTLGSAIKVTANTATHLFNLWDDSTMVDPNGNSATAGNPDGFIAIQISGVTHYIWTYTNKT